MLLTRCAWNQKIMSSRPANNFWTGCCRILLVTLAVFVSGGALAKESAVHYYVEFLPQKKIAKVRIEISEAGWLRQARFPLRKHDLQDLKATGELENKNGELLWRPQTRDNAQLSYTIAIPHQRASGQYDAYITDDWALLRGEHLVPPIKIRRLKKAKAKVYVTFVLPQKWTSVNTGWYRTENRETFELNNSAKIFARPAGWLIAGILGTRHEQMFKTQISISAPRGHAFRQMELMTFLTMVWPHVDNLFAKVPEKILIVGAPDPMWRGGLSSPTSLYLHSDRPLVSENGTSTVLHELIHVISGIHGLDQQDWITEGLAEFYGVEILYRAGGYSSGRREKIFADLAQWGRDVKSLRQNRSSGPYTARAAVFFDQLDREIQQKSAGRYRLDHLLQKVRPKKYIGVQDLQKQYKALLGSDSPLLASDLVQ